MPEGDTIFRAAARLRTVLEGQVVENSKSRVLGTVVGTLVGHRIESVRPHGKHLLFHFDDGRALHSHMGMTGSWHIYRPGEAWQRPAARAAISLECQRHTAVCFTPRVLELLTATALRRHPYLQRLGPDVLAEPPAAEEVIARYRRAAADPIGKAIMNQTILSGVGNVYKSEVLFLLKLHPLTPVSQLSDEQLLCIAAKSRELMRRNLEGRPRTTRLALDGRRFWAYGRLGQPCFVCGTEIQMLRQGDAGRSTYFCPRCQPRDSSARQAE